MLQTLQTVNTIKNAVDDIGTSPQNEDGTIRGEETDEIHNKLHPGLMDVIGIAGCTYTVHIMVFVGPQSMRLV